MKHTRHAPTREAIFALLLGGGAAIGATGALALDGHDGSETLLAPAVAHGMARTPHALADMVQAVGPSVVQVQVTKRAEVQSMGMQADEFGGMPGSLQEQLGELFGNPLGSRQAPQAQAQAPAQSALGSGFIIDRSGIVLTNNHVVQGATEVKVQLSDGQELQGRVLGADPKTDIAVIKILGGGSFKAIEWGDSDRVRVGDSVFAVGSPFGLGNTVTAGIVSARSRDIGEGPYDDYLQVDAAINSGNSGGPLFDGEGRVVGMNTAIYSPSGGSVGIGFAIPEAMAKRIANQIVAHGKVSRGRIGVALQGITPEVANALGVEGTDGALIASVEPDSPAFNSGLKEGDLVLRFDGKPVKDSRIFARMVADAKSGRGVPIVVLRNGQNLTLHLRIGGDENV